MARYALMRLLSGAAGTMLIVLAATATHASGTVSKRVCDSLGIDPRGSTPLAHVDLTGKPDCKVKMSNEYPIPDPACTPGAVNPSLTLDVLRSPKFKTGCVRDKATSAQAKTATYDWYGISRPKNNHGKTQVCELDHLISLELGGADTLDNIWPQCGPSRTVLKNRYFKQKDMVENYLAAQVRAGAIPLTDAQKGIATDWTQYLGDAKQCQRAKTKCPTGQLDSDE